MGIPVHLVNSASPRRESLRSYRASSLSTAPMIPMSPLSRPQQYRLVYDVLRSTFVFTLAFAWLPDPVKYCCWGASWTVFGDDRIYAQQEGAFPLSVKSLQIWHEKKWHRSSLNVVRVCPRHTVRPPVVIRRYSDYNRVWGCLSGIVVEYCREAEAILGRRILICIICTPYRSWGRRYIARYKKP